MATIGAALGKFGLLLFITYGHTGRGGKRGSKQTRVKKREREDMVCGGRWVSR